MTIPAFKPCIVMPCFNHGYALVSLVPQLESVGLPVVIVNDASTDDTASLCNALTDRYSWLSVVHRERNGGKGAAVRDGIRWAIDNGFSHTVMIDSDGQHDLSDLPRFLKQAEESRMTLILGQPVFGAEAPLARRIGRELSNLFVALVTCSLSVRDVLCGFRVYPLRMFDRVVPLGNLQQRMGFDVEVVVRAVWGGVPVKNIPTVVSYPKDGVSHFRYGADNLQLIALYARLALLGLYKGPRRLLRSLFGPCGEGSQWYEIAERGSITGLKVLLIVLEKVGRMPLFFVLGPVVAYMFLFGGASRRAALAFQAEIVKQEGRTIPMSSLYARALRQFWEFGVSIVEKVISWREGIPIENFTWVGRDEVKEHLATGRGVIFMGAHVGNVEVIRALGETRNVVINALMFTDNSKHFRALLQEINKQSFLRVVELSQIDPSTIFDLQARVNRGEVVALLGDRVPRNSAERYIHASFIGRPARFPEGPWILSSLLEAPVFSVFSMREPGGRYYVEFERVADQVVLPRAQRREALQRYAQTFSDRLASIMRRYPYQWFNFYAFWSDDNGVDSRVEEPSITSTKRVAR